MKTIRREVVKALQNLSSVELKHFCDELRDRRQEPRITRSQVMDKDPVDLADLLVQTFTEPVALTVTLETLRSINCNEEAKRLESKTCTNLETATSHKAQVHSAQSTLTAKQSTRMVRKPEDVKAEARGRVESEGGDCGIDRLGQSKIEFGKNKGETFKWLLENDVAYVVYLVTSHLKEQVDKNSQNPQMANKNALTEYAMLYPEIAKEVRARLPVPDGKVGFGKYKRKTRKNLYESKDKEIISYVEWLRGQKETCTPESPMADTIRYILQRDQGKSVAGRGTRRAATKPYTRR